MFIVGSIHLLKKDNFPLPEVIEAAFRHSQVAAFETDLRKLEEPAFQVTFAGKAALPPGDTLRKLLPPSLYARLGERLRAAGMPGDMFDHLKPSFTAVTLEVLALKDLGFDPEFGLDLYFYKRARQQAKPVVALESPNFQVDLLTQFSSADGELLLKTTLDDLENMRKEFSDMLQAWQDGDTAALEKLLNHAMREAPDLQKRLVTDRNHRWAPIVQELAHRAGNAIVIVGTGHLVGPEGLIELLREEGLPVVQQ